MPDHTTNIRQSAKPLSVPRRIRHGGQSAFVAEMTNRFPGTFLPTLDAVLRQLVQELPKLGIPGCYLSLYDNQDEPDQSARLIMACRENGCIDVKNGEWRVPSSDLVPYELCAQQRAARGDAGQTLTTAHGGTPGSQTVAATDLRDLAHDARSA